MSCCAHLCISVWVGGVCVCVSDLGVVCVLESQAKVVPLQQVQMATHHVQQSLALGKFLLRAHTHTHTSTHIRTHSKWDSIKVQAQVV